MIGRSSIAYRDHNDTPFHFLPPPTDDTALSIRRHHALIILARSHMREYGRR